MCYKIKSVQTYRSLSDMKIKNVFFICKSIVAYIYNESNIIKKQTNIFPAFISVTFLSKLALLFVKSFTKVYCQRLMKLINYQSFIYLNFIIHHYFYNVRFYQCLIILKS